MLLYQYQEAQKVSLQANLTMPGVAVGYGCFQAMSEHVNDEEMPTEVEKFTDPCLHCSQFPPHVPVSSGSGISGSIDLRCT